MTVIIEYGVGNLFSLRSSFAAIGEEVCVSADPDVIRRADRLVLPGVGAFEDAVAKLRANGLDQVIIDCAKAGTPLLGICLGMQMLFERSYEYGVHEGLGLLHGEVRPISDVIHPTLKVPHIGWNALHFVRPDHPVFRYVKDGDCVYFVHSYAAFDTAACVADTEYSAPLTAAVAEGCVCGCQFHPEKSGHVGLAILRGFCEWDGKGGTVV